MLHLLIRRKGQRAITVVVDDDPAAAADVESPVGFLSWSRAQAAMTDGIPSPGVATPERTPDVVAPDVVTP